MKIVAITGGIGSGKSIVSTFLRKMGYKVYDCDSEAKYLTETSTILINRIKEEFGDAIVSNGQINRKNLAEIVFKDKSKLTMLNRIVHPFVKDDIMRWIRLNNQEKLLFIETAILNESGINDIVDNVILVNAPESIRISRVMKRNSIDKESVEARIKSQTIFKGENTYIINNNDCDAITPQILEFISQNT
ncbi:MAG: dephospho-CoA kinase [Muribaculaceae bacterium]|nr:dephospho-CoA kinase [Muribaculaceae bacterium]